MEHCSIWYCRRTFGHYGTFATLRLLTAVAHHDIYSLSGFRFSFRSSGKEHENNPGLRKFVNSLDYADAEHFSTEEIRFLLRISTSYKKLTDDQIEAERDQIKRDVESNLILSPHAEYLLKAVDYWKMHFKNKIEKWRDEFVEANRGWTERRILAEEDVTGNTVMDHGYYSGDDGDENE